MFVNITPAAKKARVATMDILLPRLMPMMLLPLGQPPAQLAPNPMRNPPIKSQTALKNRLPKVMASKRP